MSQEKTSQIEFGLKDGKLTVLRKEPKMDLTGQRFGKLTVLRKESKSKYRCFCDCGNEFSGKNQNLSTVVSAIVEMKSHYHRNS